MIKKKLGIIILSVFLFSCSSNLDFNQVNDLKLQPVIISNLATFDILANQFVTNGVEQSVFSYAQSLDITKDAFFNKSLTRADLFFEINNTINRAYIVDVDFLNDNNSKLYIIRFNVPAFTGVEKLVTKNRNIRKQ